MRKRKRYFTIEASSCDVEFIGYYMTFKAAFKVATKNSTLYSRMVINEEQLKHIVLNAIEFICEEEP